MRDRDTLFHARWLGLAQPIEGLVFSVPALADAQIAPDERPELSAAFSAQLDPEGERLRSLTGFFRDFLGYTEPGMLVLRDELPADLAFYAAEGGQEIRPSFALARGPFTAAEDPFAIFEAQPQPGSVSPSRPGFAPNDAPSDALSPASNPTQPQPGSPPSATWFALAWDLTETAPDLDLDTPEDRTGPWRYPPTAKFERLLRHVGIPIGLIFNGPELRLLYAPAGETTAHLTFRVPHMRGPEGRPLVAALELLLHARRAYGAAPEHTLEGLLAESRRRQADVTEELAKQVFEAVEILVAGFEAAAARDAAGDALDWLRPALEAPADHFYQGVLSVVLRLVFLLYAEDQALLPIDDPTYAQHLGLAGLYARLAHDAGAHPESMHHRFGAYGQLLALFRAVFFGVRHGRLTLPPRRGRLFDPNTYPFLEGGLPGWTAAGTDPRARAEARPPSLDDGTIYRVLHRLVVFKGQRLSYRTLDVEQIGSVYESLMGYHVLRTGSPAVRLGKLGVWVEAHALRAMSASDRARFLKETCGLAPGPLQAIEKAVKEAGAGDAALAEALAAHAAGRRESQAAEAGPVASLAQRALRHRANAGQLVLQPGEERRRTGSHYTPRALTEKVVRRTLEPLLACLGAEPTPEQILQLKICDPAMGSGAFLVAACRELASAIVAAWTRRGELARIIEQHGDAHLHARRLVAQRCLYGVDKNPAAVELAKLSLWLVTLSRTLPFTFVDHALRQGDSLVGLDFSQIEAFHWAPPGQVETVRVLLRDALDQAVELRQQILALAEQEDSVAQGEKRRLFDFSQQAIDRVRLVADACVGAFFAEAKDAAREKERKRRLALVESWLSLEQRALEGRGDEAAQEADRSAAASAREALESLALEAREKLSPFHWWLEFPEVFFEERPDPLQGGSVNGAARMEGVVGNPPFMGGSGIIEAFGELGEGYRDWVFSLHGGAHGKCDLVAHFFRRAGALLGRHGTMGLVTTNTISQGDTREGGLAPLLAEGFEIYDATASMPWPGSAAVTVSLVYLANGHPLQSVPLPRLLNGKPVGSINSRFASGSERASAQALAVNESFSFMGCKIGGQGFVLSLEEAAMLDAQQISRGFVKPYIGGEEVNSSPTQAFERCVIDFVQAPLEAVEKASPELLGIVRERVKPYRDTVRRDTWRKRWWQFAEVYPSMRAAIAPLERCLVNSQVSKHLIFAFQPTDRIFAHTLYAYPLPYMTAFAVLQSRIHERWARLLSSSMKTDLRYSPSDCFDTFTFPQPDPRTLIPTLEEIGEKLYQARADYMIDTEKGLTKTYNALKDPACEDPRILDLRRLHEAMDCAVLAAYGWSDIPVPAYCPKTEQDREALQAFEDEVIDRLYVLNAERSREEQRLGLTGKKRGRATAEEEDPGEAEAPAEAPTKKGRKGKKPVGEQGKLF